MKIQFANWLEFDSKPKEKKAALSWTSKSQVGFDKLKKKQFFLIIEFIIHFHFRPILYILTKLFGSVLPSQETKTKRRESHLF